MSVLSKMIRALRRNAAYRYQMTDGRVIAGLPVSQVPDALRDCGWTHVENFRSISTLRDIGGEIVTARYVGGVRPKRFCEVLVLDWVEPYAYNAHVEEFYEHEYYKTKPPAESAVR